MSVFLVLSLCLVLALLVFAGLWTIAQFNRDPSFVDAFWAFGIVLMAVTAFALSGHASGLHALWITGLVLIWGLRLGGHLFLRWRHEGPDRRYKTLLADVRTKRGWSYARTTAVFVFAPQAVLMWITSLPAQLGQVGPGPDSLGPVALVGLGLAVFGIAFETLADLQLARFKQDPDQAGRVMDQGLWAWTRHPNYFGEACTWWGVWLIAAETPYGLYAIIGPVFLTFTLMRWSGAPMLEKGLLQTRPGYAEYVARTSTFFPRPPRKDQPKDTA